MAVQNRIVKVQKRNRALVGFDTRTHTRQIHARTLAQKVGLALAFFLSVLGSVFNSFAQSPEIFSAVLPAFAVKSNYDPTNKLVRLELSDPDQFFRIYGPDYDVFVTTNAISASTGLDATNWSWVRRVRFGETNLTLANVWTTKPYFLLGTMLNTDGDYLPDAFEMVVSKTNPQLRDSNQNGIEDGDEMGVNGLPWALEQVRHSTTVIFASKPAAVEGGARGEFTIRLPHPAPKGGALLQYRLHGSAVFPDEFSISPPAGSITIPAGKQSGNILVTAINNKTYEDLDRYVEITLTDCSMGPVLSYPAQVELVDGDLPAVRVMALPPRLEEPSPTYGTNAGEFYFIRDGAATNPVTLNFAIGGTARSGVNFAALPRTVSFQTNQRTISLPIKPLRDVKSWADTTVILTITSAVGYQIDPSNGVATVTIANLDTPALPIVQVTATISNASVSAPGQFTFTRSGPAYEPLRIYYDQVEETIVGYQNGQPIVSRRALTMGHAYISEEQTKVIALVIPDNPPPKHGTTLTITIRAHKDYSVGPARTAAVQIK